VAPAAAHNSNNTHGHQLRFFFGELGEATDFSLGATKVSFIGLPGTIQYGGRVSTHQLLKGVQSHMPFGISAFLSAK
jgi:hypothetical protein